PCPSPSRAVERYAFTIALLANCFQAQKKIVVQFFRLRDLETLVNAELSALRVFVDPQNDEPDILPVLQHEVQSEPWICHQKIPDLRVRLLCGTGLLRQRVQALLNQRPYMPDSARKNAF